MTQQKPPVSDQAVRDRFEKEVDRNFSVIAPAGVGKTEAIVRRVISIAALDPHRAREWLPKLVVVTYTNRAADEMRYRCRNGILETGVDVSILSAFNQAFFGTIHQFCLKLLASHGHHLGLPAELELLEDEPLLWRTFLRQLPPLEQMFPQSFLSEYFNYRSAWDLLELAGNMDATLPCPPQPGPCPPLILDTVLNFPPPNNAGKRNVLKFQALLQQLMAQLDSGISPITIPAGVKGGKAFEACWRETFKDLFAWLGKCDAWMCIQIAREFRRFRISEGQLTYNDQITLAEELLDCPEIGDRLRGEGYRIILDEAQDTDPHQFRVLTELARPVGATGDWVETGQAPPRPGHFSMVGDLQQSIYGERADLPYYGAVHGALCSSSDGEELIFEVTFRCDQAIIDWVNAVGCGMLAGAKGQVRYVPLKPRPEVHEGQVIRWVPNEVCFPEDSKRGVNECMAMEAHLLSKWIQEQGLEGLRADRWSEVAILCPRKGWFDPFARALRRVGIKCQVQSEESCQGDSPAFAWLTALLAVFSEPDNHFELVGVLREVFGLSDQQLADYCQGNCDVLNIEDPPSEKESPVSEKLNQLAKLRRQVIELPLRDAVHKIVEETQLRSRLDVLTDYPTSLLQEEIDEILFQTAQAEADGLSLFKWTERSKLRFQENQEEQTVQEDCLQLITCHKAKGLQWQAVILAGFFRCIGYSQIQYPMVFRQQHGDAPLVVSSGDELKELGLKERIDLKRSQENQRLLYVSMTRARRTLVLADGCELFPKHAGSFFELLRLDESSGTKLWDALPRVAEAEERVSTGIEEPEPLPAGEEPVPVLKETYDRAMTAASQFTRRVFPSSLASHTPMEEPELKLTQESVDPDPALSALMSRGAEYGNWWHELMQRLDWKDPSLRQKQFHQALHGCPEPVRGKEEWELFQQSELVSRLSGEDSIYHPEMPLLVFYEDNSCLEGFMDLAVRFTGEGQWWVIDWKTDRVESVDGAELVERYGAQIKAYMEALKKVAREPVEGFIYSTRLGTLLTVR